MSSNHSPFSIRPIKATGDRKPKSLGEFIARVNITHPGGFRALNQAEVRRQIEEKDRKQHGDPDTPDVHMEDGAGSEDEADPEASSDLGAARMKILQNISYAAPPFA
jgi:mediator of RNA polymerase II transcription subunit 17